MSEGNMTWAEKLAEARRLLNRCDRTNLTDALRLTLDLIETSEDALPIPTYSAPLDANDGVSPPPDFAAMAEQLLSFALFPVDHRERLKKAEEFLSSVWPKPGPAVVRDEAWWLASAQSLVHACWLDLGTEKREKIAWWLRANAHRFATPTPAVVRDEAWWKMAAMNIASMAFERGRGTSMVDDIEALLKHTFGQDPAPDPARREVKAIADCKMRPMRCVPSRARCL